MTILFSRRTGIIAYIVAWLLALIATSPSGRFLSLAWMFPIGLLRIFYPTSLLGGGTWQLPGCYLVYLFHALGYFRARTKFSTALWLALLVALLICNVTGCREMINSH